MKIYEIVFSCLLLLTSVFVCFVTLNMDKSSSISVVQGMSKEMRKTARNNTIANMNRIVAVCTAIIMVICLIFILLAAFH